jgi:phosphoribosylpyrophosphate synthetase
MELLIMLDRVSSIVSLAHHRRDPYYGYGRSDKKDRPRVPILGEARREP